MRVGVVNMCSDAAVTPDALREIADALARQSFDDVAPTCQTAGVPCDFFEGARAVVVDTDAGPRLTVDGMPRDVSPHLVLDDPDQEGELGDHFVTADGIPILRTYWNPIRDSGGTLLEGLAPVMGHEHCEASFDPYANAWVDMPDGVTEEAFEVCDRLEAFTYVMAGTRVTVPNFLTSRAFRDGPGPYDKMGILSQPWELPPGCYVIRRAGGPGGNTKAIFGDGYPEEKKRLKLHPRSRASRRGCTTGEQDEKRYAARHRLVSP